MNSQDLHGAKCIDLCWQVYGYCGRHSWTLDTTRVPVIHHISLLKMDITVHSGTCPRLVDQHNERQPRQPRTAYSFMDQRRGRPQILLSSPNRLKAECPLTFKDPNDSHGFSIDFPRLVGHTNR